MKRVIPALLGLLLLAGCAETAPEKSDAAETSETTPDVEYATPQQVASVIAEHEADWREVADKQGECRLTWTLDSQADPIAALNGTSCYMNEQTATTTAKIALRDLAELTPPPELESLVAKTVPALQAVADVDWAGTCGVEGWPADTDECSATLGGNTMNFTVLTSRLDAWGPYL